MKLTGKDAVVVGRSNIVGAPMALLLQQRDATVTLCHSRTPHAALEAHCRRADILVSAAGRPGLIRGHMIKVWGGGDACCACLGVAC